MASISAGGESHGGKKSVDSEIPLIPFIDLLLCCVMFLLVTAVWNKLASVDALLDGPGTPEATMTEPDRDLELPLTVRIGTAGYTVASEAGDQTEIPKVAEGEYDLATLHEHLRARHRIDPNQERVVLTADDGVSYEHIVAAMDVFMAESYPEVTVSGTN
ncbi:MAG: ExbD/TolR family protein [Sandaracinaceae bacterium]